MRLMVSAAHRTMCCSCAVIAAAMSRIAPACCAFSPATLNACCAARASTLCAPLVTGIMCTWRKGGRDKDAISFVARGHTAHIYTSGLGKKAQSSTFQQSSVPIPPPPPLLARLGASHSRGPADHLLCSCRARGPPAVHYSGGVLHRAHHALDLRDCALDLLQDAEWGRWVIMQCE